MNNLRSELPSNIEEAEGLIIQLRSYEEVKGQKDYDPTYDKANFGEDSKYVFVLQSIKNNEWKTDNERIRVYPLEQYAKPNAQIHLLFTMIGYQSIREKFKVIDKLKFSVGMAM